MVSLSFHWCDLLMALLLNRDARLCCTVAEGTTRQPLQLVNPAAYRLLWNTGFGVWCRCRHPAQRFLGVGVEQQRVGAIGSPAKEEAAAVVGGPQQPQPVAAD